MLLDAKTVRVDQPCIVILTKNDPVEAEVKYVKSTLGMALQKNIPNIECMPVKVELLD